METYDNKTALLRHASAVEGIKLVPYVCGVCQFVSTLTAEPFDVWTNGSAAMWTDRQAYFTMCIISHPHTATWLIKMTRYLYTWLGI